MKLSSVACQNKYSLCILKSWKFDMVGSSVFFKLFYFHLFPSTLLTSLMGTESLLATLKAARTWALIELYGIAACSSNRAFHTVTFLLWSRNGHTPVNSILPQMFSFSFRILYCEENISNTRMANKKSLDWSCADYFRFEDFVR